MGDMGDGFKMMREDWRERRDRLGINCPGCQRERPSANPTRLMPGRKCRVCGTTYEQAKQQIETREHRKGESDA